MIATRGGRPSFLPDNLPPGWGERMKGESDDKRIVSVQIESLPGDKLDRRA
jgi:hypothetical protein